MTSLPLVGLPTDHKQIGAHPFLAVGEKYARAVVDGAEAVPVLLPTLEPALPLRQFLESVDGILLTGSVSNIEPHHYSDESSYEGNLLDPKRDATNLALIPLAMAMGVPLLAICRGFQEVNVAFGGSLYQKVHEQPGFMDHRERPDDPLEKQYGPAHAVALTPGGMLADIASAESAQVNSLHGQGISRLGAGLAVEAVAPDGLIEAFRHDGPGFLLGVQWHPEWRVRENPFYLSLFQAFGAACRARAAQRTQRNDS
ncbi:gamma-glutamyl-gamma-aminobutyrate hydrolase family protein [Pseudoxanthomonas sp. UTMC 1351]|uniref:gamma-glutamyl-gamma-aminobutyrate hydrolase family protein n=1 Tax=Pseudoxanthomonas sp. UTMC 1351 TaxID=2695853 RepID=UPI0034CD272B